MVPKMAPFDTAYTTSWQSVIVNTPVSCTTFEILDTEEYHDLEV